MLFKYYGTKVPRLIFCIILTIVIVFFTSNNTLELSPQVSSQKEILISLPDTECIRDMISLREIEDAKIFRAFSEQIIDEIAISHLIHTPQGRAGQYSVKAKILAENDCDTWYVKITIPDAEEIAFYYRYLMC